MGLNLLKVIASDGSFLPSVIDRSLTKYSQPRERRIHFIEKAFDKCPYSMNPRKILSDILPCEVVNMNENIAAV